MPSNARPHIRDAAHTRARILEAAQLSFSEKGYSLAGLREIAARAGVVNSLVVKYFGTKAKLFEEALAASIGDSMHLQEKAGFGEALMRSVLDPEMRITAPAMIALSLGDQEAREISAKVAREHIIAPLAAWIGQPHGEARAASTLMLSVGFAIFNRYMQTLSSPAEQIEAQTWLVGTIQAIVDGQDWKML